MNHKWNYNDSTKLGELVFDNKTYIILTGDTATICNHKYNDTPIDARDDFAVALGHAHRVSTPGASQRAS